MPGDPRQRRYIGGARLDERIRLGDDLDVIAIVEGDDVIGPQASLESDVEGLPLHGGDTKRATSTLGVIEQHAVDRSKTAGVVSCNDVGRTRHGRIGFRDGQLSRAGRLSSAGLVGPGSATGAPPASADAVDGAAAAACASLRW